MKNQCNNYILILSDEDDSTTDDVLDWLDYFNAKYIRINGSNEINFYDLKLDFKTNNFRLIFLNEVINSNNIISYWYRRGHLNFKVDYLDKSTHNSLNIAANSSINREYFDLSNYIYDFLERKHGIGSFHENQTNKLVNLITASKIGLKIPNTQIFTTKSDLRNFIELYGQALTKPIGQAGLNVKTNNYVINGVSKVINKSDLINIPESFPPSLFQEYVDKAYELRIFYLHKKIYSSAIFSQRDIKTKIDFRNYNYSKPNRVQSYKLPQNIEKLIVAFMEKIKMDSGSIDIIVTPRKEYYFLEVNPIGQFFQVSYPCNYYLEKKVAEYLLCNS